MRVGVGVVLGPGVLSPISSAISKGLSLPCWIHSVLRVDQQRERGASCGMFQGPRLEVTPVTFIYSLLARMQSLCPPPPSLTAKGLRNTGRDTKLGM